MTITLGELAELVGGACIGAAATPVSGAAILRDAKSGDITLLDRAELTRQLAESSAAAVVVLRGFTPEGIAHLAVDDVHAAFAAIVVHFRPTRARPRRGVSAAARVSATARLDDNVEVHCGATIGDDVVIGPGCTIHGGVHIMAGCVLADNVTVFPNVVLYEDTMVGPRVVIHAGAVLGAYGFGYETIDGEHRRCAQLGYVEIEADVEIGACTTIDRGTYGPTRVGAGTKIDNHVMIAHNCRIGRHNILCSQVGIAGSTTTGDYVVMAGQVGVRDHVHIGERAVLAAKAGIPHDIPPGAVVVGIPARPERDFKLRQAAIAKLPDMRKQLRRLQREVEEHLRSTGRLPDQDAA